MGQNQIVDPKRRYLPSLEGVRGYGFLLVFCGHYFRAEQLARPDTVRLQLFCAFSSVGLFAVPAFFVLSGYLIGGILFHTRNREGFFKVFYSRRILRVFPIYYLTLLAIAIVYKFQHFPTDFHFWAHFLYIQNLLPGYSSTPTGAVTTIHFWSLAVEEQFYLLWPLVVWRFRERRQLIAIATALVVACCAVRLAAPLLSISALGMSFFTLTRVDAILLGVLLNLTGDTAMFRRLMPLAKWVTLCSVVTLAMLGYFKGITWSQTYSGKEIWIPLGNLAAAAIIVAVIEEGSVLNRMCSQRWICRLGTLSYSAYVFHLTFYHFFIYDFAAHLEAYMRRSAAILISGVLAFCITLILSLLSYRFLEGPMMNLKQHMQYGAANGLNVMAVAQTAGPSQPKPASSRHRQTVATSMSSSSQG
jgi:peptidoglycan/LPS O-acetylase OafA/YrhL